ncbi:MAG: 16S rRNA (guanine(527)-N(7))-methyltransferase RsmG [Acidobacteriota bacterium]
MNGEANFLPLLAPHVTGEQAARLALFAALLERWAPHHNLVKFADRKELVERHILDALAAEPHLGQEGRLLDVGSGAGLPGVPILAVRPCWDGVLLEPRQKRWAFLRMVIRELGLRATAERARYQDLTTAVQWDLITTRAVGEHDKLLRWARDRLTPDGAVFLWSTEEVGESLAEHQDWAVLSSKLPGLDRGRLLRLKPCFT